MASVDYLRFVGALILVLGLIAGGAWAFRRVVASAGGPGLSRVRRLGVVEALPLDARHRLVLVRRDDVEHLILIGPSAQTVVEGAIRPALRALPAEEPRP